MAEATRGALVEGREGQSLGVSLQKSLDDELSEFHPVISHTCHTCVYEKAVPILK